MSKAAPLSCSSVIWRPELQAWPGREREEMGDIMLEVASITSNRISLARNQSEDNQNCKKAQKVYVNISNFYNHNLLIKTLLGTIFYFVNWSDYYYWQKNANQTWGKWYGGFKIYMRKNNLYWELHRTP